MFVELGRLCESYIWLVFTLHQQNCLVVKTLELLAIIAAVAELNEVLVKATHVRRTLILACGGARPWEVRVKAWRVLVDILTFGTESSVITMCSESMMIRSLCNYLKHAKDDHVLTVHMLQAIHAILLLARDRQTLKSAMNTFDRCQLPDILNNLTNSESDAVYDMADLLLNMLEQDAGEDDAVDQNCVPEVAADQQSFLFGLAKLPTDNGVQQNLPHEPSKHNSPLGLLRERNAHMDL